MTKAECLAEMTDGEREWVLKQPEEPEWLIGVEIRFSEKELRWMAKVVPADREELLDAKLAQARISMKQYLDETESGRSPDDWIDYLKQEKAKQP